MPTQSPLKTAPPFELPNQKGDPQALAGLLEKGRVLLVFHRGTW
jgi:peroxiredoxin